MFDYVQARQHMVDSQIRTGDVTDLEVLRAFKAVPREKFVPTASKALAYSDNHIDLEDGRFLTKPRDAAKMIHAADVKASDVVLDIACGRGYSSAILGMLADTVVGLEDDAERVTRASTNLLDIGVTNAAVIEGNLMGGAPKHGPFNVIFVNGAVAEVPGPWLDQLANGGRLVAVIQDGPVGRAHLFVRSGDAVSSQVIFDASQPMLEAFKPAPAFVF